MRDKPLSATQSKKKTRQRKKRPKRKNSPQKSKDEKKATEGVQAAVGTLTRTKSLLLAALRVWDLKQRGISDIQHTHTSKKEDSSP
jgi:hypothetical protein